MVLGISISVKQAKKKKVTGIKQRSQYLKGRNKTVNLSLLADNMTVYKKIKTLQTLGIQQSL